MSSRGTYRRHSPQFRLQLCQDIRSGAIGRRDAARHHNLSTNLLQLWLTQYDRGELSSEEAEASTIAEYEARIAALERKVGQNSSPIPLLIVGGTGIRIGHAVAQRVVEQDRDFPRRGGDRLGLADAGRQAPIEGTERGLRPPDGHCGQPQQRRGSAAGAAGAGCKDFAAGDLVAGRQAKP